MFLSHLTLMLFFFFLLPSLSLSLLSSLSKKSQQMALTDVAQSVEHSPTKQKITGSIPGQGACLG